MEDIDYTKVEGKFRDESRILPNGVIKYFLLITDLGEEGGLNFFYKGVLEEEYIRKNMRFDS